MKFGRFEQQGRVFFGSVEDDAVIELDGSPFETYQKTGKRHALSALTNFDASVYPRPQAITAYFVPGCSGCRTAPTPRRSTGPAARNWPRRKSRTPWRSCLRPAG